MAAHLKEILDPKALTPPAPDGHVKLRDRAMEVQVVELPPDLTAIRMEKLGRLRGLRDGAWMQICDYLLVFSQEGKNQAVFVELKKTLNGDRSKAMEQLRRSLPFLDYLLSVCEIHFAREPGETAVRYLLIGERVRSRFDRRPSVNPDPERNLVTQEYKNITISTFVGSRFPLESLPGTASG